MSWQYSCKFQTPASFYDVAACFSEQEWKLLQDWQKELYNNVMKDIHQALVSLGPLIAASVFSLRGEENVDPVHMNPQDSEKRHSISHSPSDPGLTSVFSLTVKSEDETNLDKVLDPGREYRSDAGLTSVFSLTVKSEDETNFDLVPGRESRSNDIIDREMETIDFVQLIERASSSSIKNTQNCIESSDSSANNGCKLWLESNQDPESEKTGQSEILLKNPEHNIVYHGFLNAEAADQNCDRVSNLKNECQAIMLQNSEHCLYGACDETDSHEHKMAYTGQRLYQRTEREKGISRNVDLYPHQRAHMAERTYQLTKGEKGLNRKRERFMHHQTKAVNRLYQCCECGKTFLRNDNFIRHQKAHLGERPYLCTECGKCFTQKINLIRHYKIHTGEKPYLCTVCGKRFISKNHLIRHLKTHK